MTAAEKQKGSAIPSPWEPWEKQVIRDNYPTLCTVGCARLLPTKTHTQIRSMASQLGVTHKGYASDKEKFESKLIITPGCWVYVGGKDADGYGQFRATGRNVRAHRYAYEIYEGPIPDGMDVCHSCDNRKCANPNHLWLGTHTENNADRHRKGRTARVFGEARPNTKLKTVQVYEIRRAAGTYAHIAKQYGISDMHVSRIKRRIYWAHLPEEDK